MSTDLTFFIWADTHFGYDQRPFADDLRGRIISQMHDLPGWPYPPHIGGAVDRPSFVLLCGDAVDGAPGDGEAELEYYRYFSSRLAFDQYEVLGNHDTDPIYTADFVARYGGLSHSFQRDGVHFICLNSRYDDGEYLAAEDVSFLQQDLASTEQGTPVVLFVHCRLDRFRNTDEALLLLADHHILLVVGAHVHKPAVFQTAGIDCLDVGQCRDHPIDPAYGRNLYVVRITDDRLVAVPWRWDLGDWERGQRWANPEETTRRFTMEKCW